MGPGSSHVKSQCVATSPQRNTDDGERSVAPNSHLVVAIRFSSRRKPPCGHDDRRAREVVIAPTYTAWSLISREGDKRNKFTTTLGQRLDNDPSTNSVIVFSLNESIFSCRQSEAHDRDIFQQLCNIVCGFPSNGSWTFDGELRCCCNQLQNSGIARKCTAYQISFVLPDKGSRRPKHWGNRSYGPVALLYMGYQIQGKKLISCCTA